MSEGKRISTGWDEYDQAVEGQAIAARPDESAWVTANAGSGKTHVLINRVARILLKDVAPHSILCVTYTRAAASEMQTRLFEKLGEWCIMDAEHVRKDLARLEQREPDSYTDEDIGRARELFARALETPGGLRIETIHAFCGRLLRRFPLEAQIAPGFKELDEADAERLMDRTRKKLGARVGSGEQDLMEAARIVWEAGDGFGAVGALSPHRDVIKQWIDRCEGFKPALKDLQRICGAGEDSSQALLRRALVDEFPRVELMRVLEAVSSAAPGHDLCDPLRDACTGDDLDARFAAWKSLAYTDKGKLRAKNPFNASLAKTIPDLAAMLSITGDMGSEIRRIQAAVTAIQARQLYERSAALLRLHDVLTTDYANRKRARASLDFDDLIARSGALLNESFMSQWVLWKLDGGLTHILVDEAQDTSPSQWRIVNALTSDIFAGKSVERKDPRTLFAVGDHKQSIYSFQGADPDHFQEVFQDFHTRAAASETTLNMPALAMSFRSSPEILAYVDAVFDPKKFEGGTPFSKNPPVDGDQPRHTAHRRFEPGCVEVWPLERKDETEEGDAWDAPIVRVEASSPKARLANRIADFVRGEIDRGARVWEKKAQRACRPGDFLILVRGRKGGLFDAILQALKKRRVPVAGADRLLLLESLAVQDLLNLVRFALCPEDDLTLAEILKGPFGRSGMDSLGDDDLLTIAPERTGTLWRAVQDTASPRFSEVRAFLEDLLRQRDLPAFEFLSHALEEGTGLAAPGWEMLLSRFDAPVREPVAALLDRAAAMDASLQIFLSETEQRGGEVKRELSAPQDEVRVMTVHGAKGLQAPIVILPDTTSAVKGDRDGVFLSEEGAVLWPGAKINDTLLTMRLRDLASARELHEHRRLLYVALTRAQDRLVICGAALGNAKDGAGANSWYALCAGAMTDAAERGAAQHVSDGGPASLRMGDAPPALEAVTSASLLIPPPGWMFEAAAQEAAASRMVSPSALGHREPAVLSPFGPRQEERLRRGRLIHTLFEALPGADPSVRRAAAERFLKRQKDLTPKARKEIANAVLGVLERPDFADLFGDGGLAEAPVVGQLGEAVINGRIDRLVIRKDAILIIDYKTDRPAPKIAAGVSDAYALQLAAYRAILSEAWPGRPCRCFLVWTDGPQLMEVPGDRLDRVLEGWLGR
jgi:ATP-dependent helicase/nuclease subunit A